MSLIASIAGVTVAASAILGGPLGQGTEQAEALSDAYYKALGMGFGAMGPAMKQAAASYCHDGRSIDGYCTWVDQGAIIGSHLSGNYEDVLAYADRYAAAMQDYMRAVQMRTGQAPSGACLPVNATRMDTRTNTVAASWSGSVPAMTYYAQARLKRQVPGTFYQAFYCGRRAPGEMFDSYDPDHPGVPASEAEARVARKFEAEILRPMRDAAKQIQAEYVSEMNRDNGAMKRHMQKTAALYQNAYAMCGRARYPANLCDYLKADSAEAEFYSR